MIPINVIYKYLKLPIDILLTIIKYFLGITKFRKFKDRLKICIKLTIYKFALSINIKDSKYIPSFNNETLFKIIKFQYSKLINDLPHYGEKYGNHSFWFTKSDKRSKHDPIIIYAHGGGYFLQSQPEQFKSLIAISKNLNPEKNYSILYLDYDLISFEQKFPRQLRQLESVYSKLVEEGNDNIILFGDSAGGHLAISFVQYIFSHKPFLPYPTQLVLVSPWCKLKFDYEKYYQPGASYYDNESRDMITINIVKTEYEELFLNAKNSDYHPYFNWSFKPSESNWNQIPFFQNPNSKIFLIFGEDESFRDHIIEWTNEIYTEDKIIYKPTNNHFNSDCVKIIKNNKQPQLNAFMEPWGIHDSTFFVDYEVINDIDNATDEKYFGVSKIINFLNN